MGTGKPKREEITDVISPEGYQKLKVGQVLVFEKPDGEQTHLKITAKRNGRIWAEHITMVDVDTGMSHYGHNVDTTQEAVQEYGAPYCQDCERPVSDLATEEGDVKALQRERAQADEGLTD